MNPVSIRNRLFRKLHNLEREMLIKIPLNQQLSNFTQKPQIDIVEFENKLLKEFSEFKENDSIEDFMILKFGTDVTTRFKELL